MKLIVLGSSSKGNCYILDNGKEALIIEAGVSFKAVAKAINYDVSRIVGCIVTHNHGDHAGHVKEYLGFFIDVYTGKGTIDALNIGLSRSYPKVISEKETITLGGFTIKPFKTEHDCPEPFGFLINHIETGNILFATDTYYLKYKFDDLSNIMIESNYRLDILYKNLESGATSFKLKDRILESHMEFGTMMNLLRNNDMDNVVNIVLIHLSDMNSNEKEFISDVKKEFAGINIYAAKKNLEIKFNKTPY